MKMVAFLVGIVFLSILMFVFSYTFLQYLEMRPIGVAIAYLLRDVICVLILIVCLYFSVNKKIQEAIERFDENKKAMKSDSLDKVQIEALEDNCEKNIDQVV